ncbi:aldo/keto reductase [Spirosoma koreense]
MRMITLEQLSKLGIGTSRASSLGSRLSPDYFGTFLKVASANHLNLVDTSDYYGSGDAERLIRKGLRATGAPFFVLTKAGLPCVHAPGWLSPLNQLAKKVKQKAGSPKNYTAAYLIDSLQKSNKRLGVEAADGFLLHEPVWADIAEADSWEGLRQIRQRGLAHYTGVSTNDYRVVEEGIRSGQVQFVQTSACWGSTKSDDIIQLCRTHRIPVLANQVLMPFKTLQPRFDQHAGTIRSLNGLADISLAQLLIAAVLADKQVDVALFGTGHLSHLEHNLGALRYTDALKQHLPRLNALLA